jgi:hypothetical protein
MPIACDRAKEVENIWILEGNFRRYIVEISTDSFVFPLRSPFCFFFMEWSWTFLRERNKQIECIPLSRNLSTALIRTTDGSAADLLLRWRQETACEMLFKNIHLRWSIFAVVLLLLLSFIFFSLLL